ncbi:MAG: choline dehydrogenase [Rhizobiaceae bacterium]
MKKRAYDYVIVGAGSAGCVLANKLSADGSNSVLVLEAGPMDRNVMIHIPAGVYYAYRNPKLNWNYLSQPEPALDNRQIGTPRGKVVGGSSSINSMVYMRGHPLDYDRWAQEHGLTDWRYADCLPYFKAGESSDRGEDEWRGGSGPLGVSRTSYESPLYDAFELAGLQAGQGHSQDLNGFQPEGVARLDATKKNGRRCSAAVAHLHPALKRPNVDLLTGALVKRLVLKGKRAVAVEITHQGQHLVIEAEKEIILSGGAINSPQLLMLSGIGPADHLRQHGIDCLHDLTGVGQNLQDHATVVTKWACKQPVTMHRATNLIEQAKAGLQWIFTRSGLAASNVWEAGGLIRGNDSVAYPNLQYHFGPVGVEEVGDKLVLGQAFSIYVDQLRPKSRGRIELKSADPSEKPALHFNYLSKSEDLQELIEGVRKVRELVAQPAFDPYRGEELVPGPSAQSDQEIAAAIRQSTETDYHPCGTCKMEAGGDAVVDSEMRVHGLDALRVVDASVIPQIISANLNAPVQMIAARAADYILGNPQLPPLEARFHFQSS